MEILFSDELRLAYTLALNAVVFVASYRFARRLAGGDRIAAAVDAFALYYLIQYAAVALPGLVGLLSPTAISMVALGACAALWSASLRRPATAMAGERLPAFNRVLVLGSLLFVIGYCLGVIWVQRFTPIHDNDALAYHVPFAIHWLRAGWLGLFPAWFYNPANVYSPLAGSTFIAWLIAPMNNDLLARFAAIPQLIFLFLAMARLLCVLGVRPGTAALVAAAAVLCRPFVQQTILVKDDLALCAWFIVAAAALHPASLRGRAGAWRLGIAIGMFLAIKTTALLSVPLLLLAIDAPARAGWRWKQWGTAIGCALLLAGPWFARNAILTGNPLYPTDVRIGGITLFEGQFAAVRSLELRSFGGVWRTFTLSGEQGGYYTLPPIFVGLLAIGWIGAALICGRRLMRDPLGRLCTIGPPLGIALFIFLSPYALIRFAYPSILLLFACVGLALSWRRLPFVVAGVIALAVMLGACATSMQNSAAWFTVPAALLGGWVTIVAWPILVAPRLRAAWLGVGLTVPLVLIYVYTPAWIDASQKFAVPFWRGQYGDIAEGWRFAREELPPGSVIAYANTFHVYPLYGFSYTQYPVYAPTRPGVHKLTDLPRFPSPTTGEQIPANIVAITAAEADRDTWLANLRTSGAQYLFIGKRDLAHPDRKADVPELRFAAADPAAISSRISER